MNTDPIADMINRLSTGAASGKEMISFPYSEFKFEIAKTLEKEGYLKSVTKVGKKVAKTIEVELVYVDGAPKVQGVKRLSRPSKRVYYKALDLKPVRRGFGVMVLSTPQGVMTERQAKKEKVGGEALFIAW